MSLTIQVLESRHSDNGHLGFGKLIGQTRPTHLFIHNSLGGERILAAWSEKPLAELGDNPDLVAAEHDRITDEHGPYIANRTMRTLRAIYNHAPQNRSQAARGQPGERDRLERRETAGHRLRACRPARLVRAGCQARRFGPARVPPVYLAVRQSADRAQASARRARRSETAAGAAHPECQGGTKKAFDIPLSREIILRLVRARRFGLRMYPEYAATWVFPAASAEGHLVEQKEDRSPLAKWGNDLRQSYRTLAQTAGVSDFDACLLMNHALPGVNAGYITRHKLLEDHLRIQQQAISKAIMAPARAKLDRVSGWQLG